MTTASARGAVLALARDGDHRRVLDAGARLLPIVGADAELILAMIRSLVALGLGGPARELARLPWLAGQLEVQPVGADVQALRRSLAGVPIGRVGADELASMLETNVAGRPELASRRTDLLEALATLDIFRTRDGQSLASSRASDGTRHWHTRFLAVDEVENLQLPTTPEGPVPTVIGLGLNPLVERIVAMTTPNRFGMTVPIFIVDDRLERIAAWLATDDRRPVLAEERVLCFFGPDAVEQVGARLSAEADLPAPELYLKAGDETDLGDRINAVIRSAAATHVTPFHDAMSTIAQRAAERSPADWSNRLRPGATVMGFTSRFTTMVQHTLRDLAHAFETLGYCFVTRVERAPYTRNTLYGNAQQIVDLDPALIVLVNHFRREQPETLAGVPILSWIQDPADTVFSTETGRSLGPLDFVCGYYMAECVADYGYPRERFVSWPVPVSRHVFHDGPLTPDEEGRFACDAMYVGHCPQPPAALRAQFDANASPLLQPLLGRLEEVAVTALADGTFHAARATRIVRGVAQAHGLNLDAEVVRSLGFFLTRVYDAMYREQTMRWVAAWARDTGRRFHLYGDGWSDDPEFAPFARGRVQHGADLRAAYRGARLVIQTTPTGFQHQRTFEAYASGAFVLARRSLADLAGLPLDLFNTNVRMDILRFETRARYRGFESIVFDSAASLASRAEHYLACDDEREEIRRRFADIVMRERTYEGLVPPLVDWIRTGLAESAAS